MDMLTQSCMWIEVGKILSLPLVDLLAEEYGDWLPD